MRLLSFTKAVLSTQQATLSQIVCWSNYSMLDEGSEQSP